MLAKKITILSGKGGVGKSSITASLAVVLSRQKKIICADCDVDAPNLALALGRQENDFEDWSDLSTSQKAEFDYNLCNGCKKCYEACYFNAIDWVDNRPRLKDFSCEGCGVCELVCPTKAIKLVDVINAKIGYTKTEYGFKVVAAQLGIGESGSGKVVAEVKKKAEKLAVGAEIMLFDSAAGIGCPVIAAVSGSDYCVLVAEPSPAGLHDMKRAFDIADHFDIDCGIVINKFDLSREHCGQIEQFAQKNNLKIIGRLPYSESFPRALVSMVPVAQIDKNLEKIFNNIVKQLI